MHFYYVFDLDVSSPSLEFTVDGLRARVDFDGHGWHVGDIEAWTRAAASSAVIWRPLSPSDPLELLIETRARAFLQLPASLAQIEYLYDDARLEEGMAADEGEPYPLSASSAGRGL